MLLIDTTRKYLDTSLVSLRQIAKQIDISSSSISQFLNKKSELTLLSAIKLTKFINNSNEEKIKETLKHYIQNIQKPENLREAMEYCSYHESDDLLKELIERGINSSNRDTAEWAKIYKIDLEYRQNKINNTSLADLIRKTNIKTIEMDLFTRWLEARELNDQYNFNYVIHILEDILLRLDLLNNGIFKSHLLLRVNIGLANIYLKLNRIKDSREKAFFVLENTSSQYKKAHIQHTLGLSYLYENYGQAILYLNKSKEIFKDMNSKKQVKNVQKSINFVSNYWNKEILISDDAVDVSELQEIIHYEYRKGNVSQARKMLEGISSNDLNIKEKGYHYFYLGLINDDIDSFYISLKYFNDSNDKFHAKLSALELLKLGERRTAIDVLFGENI